MSKRKRADLPEENSYQQLKTHIGQKEISCNSPVHMNAVYEKTLKLLADGSRHAGNSVTAADELNGCGMQMEPLPSNQLTIGSNGKLVLSRCRDLTSRPMNVEKHQITDFSDVTHSAGKQPAAALISCCSCQHQLSTVPMHRALCSWCEKVACGQCLCLCDACGLQFCRLCSTPNYENITERTLCLQCSR